ncbi:TIGR01440 family protein [Paraliobacillus sp. JSM ZJ581]|uniref:TIGR01440 family protein n=1 Tax=Paraliobacillus sp. JSM ZJ581 TaxID=3342118 RepID=UPI0035A96630
MTLDQQLEQLVSEWLSTNYLRQGELFVIGCSTSEVFGKRIGTAGSEEVATLVFSAMQTLQKKTGVHLAFQCCEHLNRALVMERLTCEKYGYETVHVIPVKTAGGSMATFAYQQMKAPVLVEYIQAHAGVDIGETMIGMHLKPVAVPIRLHQRKLGQARVNAAYTRPKLIGGARGIYQ